MKSFKLGDIAPYFSAMDQDGNEIVLSEITKENDTLLFFYRCQWCPICNMHLSKIQTNLKKLEDNNIVAITVTPEKQENIEKTIRKTKITIPIIFDEVYKIMKDYNVNFIPSITLIIIYNNILGANLKESQSDDIQTLPVSTTNLIGKSMKIKFTIFNTNYMNRASIDDVLKAIREQ